MVGFYFCSRCGRSLSSPADGSTSFRLAAPPCPICGGPCTLRGTLFIFLGVLIWLLGLIMLCVGAQLIGGIVGSTLIVLGVIQLIRQAVARRRYRMRRE